MSSYDTLYCCKFREFRSEFLMYTLVFCESGTLFSRKKCNNICMIIQIHLHLRCHIMILHNIREVQLIKLQL